LSLRSMVGYDTKRRSAQLGVRRAKISFQLCQ